MTYEASHASHGHTDTGGAWLFPMLGGSLLTLIWGAYTIYVIAHLLPIALPPYPG
jgi:hypothetical protein